MKTLISHVISICVILFIVLLFPSCEKLNISPTTSIEVIISDESGKLTECNIRIIEPDPNYWSNIHSKMVKLPGTNRYTFKEVEPGDYASLIGDISETYNEFSIKAGDKVKITYTYYYWGSITVGNAFSGYYSVPYYKWRYNITR